MIFGTDTLPKVGGASELLVYRSPASPLAGANRSSLAVIFERNP